MERIWNHVYKELNTPSEEVRDVKNRAVGNKHSFFFSPSSSTLFC